MVSAGIDAGMRFVKICLIENGTILGSRRFEMDAAFRRRTREILDECAAEAVASGSCSGPLQSVVATGYGAPLLKRSYIRADEGMCIAAVLKGLPFPVKTVIDAGGLFIKIHKINENRQVSGTLTNDKCAAGSGRFLEIAADALKLRLEQVAALDLSRAEPLPITSSCAVFAESEVISMIGSGSEPQNILAGVVRSLAVKTSALMEQARAVDPVAITGGLSAVRSFVTMLKKVSGRDMVILPPGPDLAAAYGAALIAETMRPSPAYRIAARLMR